MDKAFIHKVTKHQVTFFQDTYGLQFDNPQRPILTEAQARRLLNFHTPWMGMRTELATRFPYENNKILYRNILHPRHMALNFFLPVKFMRTNPHMQLWLENAIGHEIREIERVLLNHTYEPWECLKDHTCFNVFIKARTAENKWIGIGIGISYLEAETTYHTREFYNMHEGYQNSVYRQVSEYIGYKQADVLELRRPLLKRLWRNHMLGYNMLLRKELDHFKYVHIFPPGNEFQWQAIAFFDNLLPSKARDSFQAMTLERYVEMIEPFAIKSDKAAHDWLCYLQKRYMPNQQYAGY